MQNTQHSDDQSNIPFPCDFTIKIMGDAKTDFEQIALNIVQSHFPTIKKCDKKFSKNEKYLSLSVTVYAYSKMELDKLYQDLSSNPAVLMAL